MSAFGLRVESFHTMSFVMIATAEALPRDTEALLMTNFISPGGRDINNFNPKIWHE